MEKLTNKEKTQKSEVMNTAGTNQNIFNKYTEKTKQESKMENKKVIKIVSITLIVAIIVCFVPTILTIINSNKEENSTVRIPDLMGKTYKEAEEELSNLGLNIEKNSGSSDNEDAIVVSQTTVGRVLKKGNTVSVTVLTQEEIEQKEEKEKKESQDNDARRRACSEYAKTVVATNEGSVNYVSCSSYGGTETSGKVYKLKYKTNDEHTYYYQLVSFNTDYTKVIKSTKLFMFNDYGGEETGQTQELEWAYKNTFGE